MQGSLAPVPPGHAPCLPPCSKRPFLVRNADDVLTCARHMHADSLAPIFLTSSVGWGRANQGLDWESLLHAMLRQHAKAGGKPERWVGVPSCWQQLTTPLLANSSVVVCR